MRTRLVITVLSTALVSLLLQSDLSAAPTGPADASASLDAQSARQRLVRKMVEIGLSPEEACARIDQLNAEDLATLSAHPEQLAMGGVKSSTPCIISMTTVPLVLAVIVVLLLF